MKYLSTFTGVGGFEIAIEKVFKGAKCVGYSEIDKFAIETYNKNFPGHSEINFGDIERLVFDLDKKGNFVVNEARVRLLPDFDLLVGGSPCQDFSIAKAKRKGLEGLKSRLFFAYLEILRIKKPKYFLLENVASMSKANKEKINELIGVNAETINSDKWVPQKRRRNYWFNWEMPELPKEDGPRWPELVAWSSSNDYDKEGNHKKKRTRETKDGRANTLTTGRGCGSFSSKNFIRAKGADPKDDKILTPVLCEQLQGLPVDWTKGVSDTQRYKQVGNCVNPDTIEHILKGIK
jgi:DNA (cytosine-5)-methyltransferase 3A